MKMKMPVAMAALLLAAGCAQLKVYKDEAMKGPETGFKFYVSKPYVLVAFNSPAPGALTASVIHLPDMSTPYWAKAQPGLFGNSNLKMDFENGVMKGFGQDVTSNVTGLLDSIGNLRKALAEAAKSQTEKTLSAEGEPTIFFHLYEVTHRDGAASLKLVRLFK